MEVLGGPAVEGSRAHGRRYPRYPTVTPFVTPFLSAKAEVVQRLSLHRLVEG